LVTASVVEDLYVANALSISMEFEEYACTALCGHPSPAFNLLLVHPLLGVSMKVSEMLRFVNTLYNNLSSKIKSVGKESRTSKEYARILGELQSLLSMARMFLAKAACIEQVYGDAKVCRFCHRWFYSEHDGLITLTKINPRVVISYNGSGIKISYDDREVEIRTDIVRYRINQFTDEVSINNVEELLDKKSLVMEAVGSVKGALDHVMPDLDLCIKEMRLKC